MINRKSTDLRMNKSFLTWITIIFIGLNFTDIITPSLYWLPFIIIIILPSFLIFIKTKNKFVLAYFLIWSSIYIVTFIPGINNKNGSQFESSIFVLVYFLSMISLLVIYDKLPSNMDTRYFRNILRLAANPIRNFRDGYTDRLYPIGRTDIKNEVLEEFGKFANYNLIATAFMESNKIILVFSNGWYQYIPFLKPAWQKVTFISFDNFGNLNIHISMKDYKIYKNEVTFDQLCASLGNLIILLIRMYENGKKEEIINLLKNKGNQGGWIIQHKLKEKIESLNKWILKK
jgi:hypothetical protein